MSGPLLRKRSLSLSGHRTSVALEDEFWEALLQIAAQQGCTLPALVARIDVERDPMRPLTSALRVHALLHRRPPEGAAGDADGGTSRDQGIV